MESFDIKYEVVTPELKKAPEPAKKSFSQKLRAKQKKYEQTYEQETASMKLSKEEKAARKAKAKEDKERAKKIQ